jgi:glutathione S-transferase
MLVLYGHPTSGHSYKVRLFLALAGVPHDYRIADISRPHAERSADFRAASPYGEVPTIVDDAGPLAQSNAILTRLARAHGKFAGFEGEWDRVVQWLCWEMNRVGFAVPNLRFARRFEPEPPEVLAWLEARAAKDLATLDRELGSRDWLLASGPTIADLSCSAYLWWADEAGIDLASYPAVRRWLGRLRALPGWKHPDELMKAM